MSTGAVLVAASALEPWQLSHMRRRFRIVVKWALLGRKKRYLVWGVTRWSQVSVKP